ncbi:MAG: Dbl homology domain-containing protein [Benjaminiella poitrasii]|nr:MAG: Dbl homology domain-containing protein [Benjaminiella poitrasii]
MPPYTHQSFEEIEAKEWASNTVKTILTDVSPVSFEANFSECYRPDLEINTNSDKSYQQNKNLRRSFSFLEGSLFGSQLSSEKETRNSRRSQSTFMSTIMDTPNTLITQSEPTTPVAKVSPQPTFSSRIRHSWHMDRAVVKQLFNTSDIYQNYPNQKKSNKELKGITTWRNKYAEYMMHLPQSLEFKPKDETKRSCQLYKFIMTELLTTEETYLNHLLTIKNFYMDPLMQAAKNSNKKSSLVNLKDVEIIFAFIPQLIALSTALVERLHETITQYLEDESKKDDVCIGQIFCNLEPFFEVYIAYSVNFSKSRKYLSKASSNIVYRQLVQDTMRKKATNRMLLSDYMIAPIQRITRYCLLLTDLLKHSTRSHPDYTYLEKTLKCLSALAFAMNNVQ